MTADEIAAAIEFAASALELLEPVVGLPELIPVTAAAAKLAGAVANAIDKRGAERTVVAAAVRAADAAADAAEAARFPRG